MSESEKSIVKYDANCNLCRGAVAFAQKHGRDARIHFQPLEPSSSNTIELTDSTGQHERSTAVLRIAAELKPPWSWLRHLSFVPLKWRDALYDFVARHRISWFGQHR